MRTLQSLENDVHESFSYYFEDDEQDEGDEDLREAQDRICSSSKVRVVAHPSVETPPFIAHLYMDDHENGETGHVWAGEVWREDRWPTVEELKDALYRWRGRRAPKLARPLFVVVWWQEPEVD